MMEDRPQIFVYRATDELELNAAEEIATASRAAISDRGVSFIALAGGETPRKVYRRLGSESLKNQMDWSRVHLFFTDERRVPPTDPLSNFGMVDSELISHIDIPAQNVHRIRGEVAPEKAAEEYEQELKRVFNRESARFDLVLLGLGEDGHTASLFPESKVLDDEQSLVNPIFVPRLESWRITLTLRCINRAREILFLVSGRQKASIVQRVLGALIPTKELPATMVCPTEGKHIWMLDHEAGSALEPPAASFSRSFP